VPHIHETAYPRLKNSVSNKELTEFYTPSAEEITLAHQLSQRTELRICFLVLLKTFQRLGYFIPLHSVPRPIAEHIALMYGVHYGAIEWEAYDASGSRARHVAVIRENIGVKPFDTDAREVIATSLRQAAQVREDTADLINVAIEEMIRQRYELPGFTTLLAESQRIKAEVNHLFFSSVYLALGETNRSQIDELLVADQHNKRSLWQALKVDTGAPTLVQLRLLVERLRWLKALNLSRPQLFSNVPPVKVAHFALEARSLDAGRMIEMEQKKRDTLVVALVSQQIARCLDDLGEMLIKRMRKAHRRAQQALLEYRQRHQAQTDRMIEVFHRMLLAYRAEASAHERLTALDEVIGDQLDGLLENCEAHAAYADNNYYPFLWKFCVKHRHLLFAVLDEIELLSTTHDESLLQALSFIRQHRHSRKEWLVLPGVSSGDEHAGSAKRQAYAFDLDWVPDKWWKLVTGSEWRTEKAAQVHRQYFELCVFSQLAHELMSGDIVIAGSHKFSDYREQFVSQPEYEAAVGEYCVQVGLPSDKHRFVTQLRDWLTQTARRVDAAFPENEYLSIENGEPVLRRLEKKAQPSQLRMVEQMLVEELSPMSVLDVLADTENWLHWSRHFGPLSGHDAKLDDPIARYVATVFTYGCNLGPSQAARSLKDVDRRQLAWVNQRHITEENIDHAITTIINLYNRFMLPKLWGSGERAAADGTKWDVYEQNLLSEYHIRYGGYGGIGYYHVSDTYIALFSHFIPCGVWEAVYILDGLLKNKSDIQPDTVHSDTQGQSAPVFGLAHLLGIKLMPRIRNWKDLKFFRPDKRSRYRHIDELFSEAVDWDLIATHYDDMLRVAVSIKSGKLLASTILRKLGTYSRKNRLYLAFRELGRVIRTEFLLNYLTDLALRRLIHGAINKNEGFNRFAQWVSFGGHGVLAENNRDEQRKLIKYNHLVRTV
jgi:TnpA family transposase